MYLSQQSITEGFLELFFPACISEFLSILLISLEADMAVGISEEFVHSLTL